MAGWREKFYTITTGLSWSRATVARRAGIAESNLRRYLSTAGEMKLSSAIKIAHALGVSMDMLFCDERELDLEQVQIHPIVQEADAVLKPDKRKEKPGQPARGRKTPGKQKRA